MAKIKIFWYVYLIKFTFSQTLYLFPYKFVLNAYESYRFFRLRKLCNIVRFGICIKMYLTYILIYEHVYVPGLSILISHRVHIGESHF